jgi:hypothetical protein
MISRGDLVGLQEIIETYPENIMHRDENGYSLISVAIKWRRAEIISWLLTDGRLTLDDVDWTDTPPWHVLVHFFGQEAQSRCVDFNSWERSQKAVSRILRVMLWHCDPASESKHFRAITMQFPQQTNVIHDGLRHRRRFLADETSVTKEDITKYLDGTAEPGHLVRGKRRYFEIFPPNRPDHWDCPKFGNSRKRLEKKILKF